MDFAFATIGELDAKLKAREVSAVELARAFGASEAAVKFAKSVDADRKRERFRGPLQGVPCGVEESIGLDSAVVAKLKGVGSPVVGKVAAVRAVAAGQIPFALAVETCGLESGKATTLRPTYGLVSRRGVTAVAWTMDKVGPVCRSAEDCGLVLETIAGGDSADPGSAGKGFYFVPQYARAFSDLTVGYAADLDQQAMAVLRDCGLKMQAAALPEFPYEAMVETITGAESDEASEIPARDYLRAMRIRTLVKQEFHKLFATIDVWVSPARKDEAGNLAGLPALRLPGAGGGLQLMGPAFSENTLLAIGKAFQGRTNFHRAYPVRNG